jgi:hypothetical protein
MERTVGKLVILAGVATVLAGLAIYFGLFAWFGRLPGDVRIESEHSRVYVPITSMLVVSVVLSLLFWVVRRLT